MRSRLWCLIGSLPIWVACAGEPPPPEIETGEPQAIVGGQMASGCQWPTSVAISGCTATLVHPQIITTAAHCGTNHTRATFGESRSGGARNVPIEYCRRGMGGDFAFCKLAMPVTDVPITPPLMGCEVELLKPGTKIAAAGFGRTTARGVAGGSSGVKHWVELMVHSINSAGRVVTVYAPMKGLCFGDSGGPTYLRLADGSWRAFGILSSGAGLPGKQCENGDRLFLIHKMVGWVEQESGIDITPCHDADGTWRPTAACRGFSMTPEAPGRSWANGCAEPALSPPSASCGPAFDGTLPPPPPPPDPTPPPSDAAVADAATPRDAGGRRDTGGARDSGAPSGTGGSPVSMMDTAAPPIADAAVPQPPKSDAGPPAPPPEGCACALGGRHRTGAGASLLVLAFAVALARRARRAHSQRKAA